MLLPLAVIAQIESSDSVGIIGIKPDSTLTGNISQPDIPTSAPRYPQTGNSGMSLPRQELHISRMYFPLQPPYLSLWEGARLSGRTTMEAVPGLMGIESGSVILTQDLGKFTLSGYGEALKYGFFGGLRNSYGYGGSLTYHMSDRVDITVFGSYYTSPGPMAPAMAGYVKIPKFGGYADYKINDRWGVKVGVQSYQPMVGNRREVQPMVVPYFKVGGKDLGIDVGGILYQMIRANVERHGHGRNPTMRPPVPPR